MHRLAHNMVQPLLQADWGKGDAKVEELHVEHKSVVICVMNPAMPRGAAAYTKNIRLRLLLKGLQELSEYSHYDRLDPHPPRGKGLERSDRWESVPSSNGAQH